MGTVRNFTHPNFIDYRILSAGLNHYESLGYSYREAPWVVSNEAIQVTLPPNRQAQTLPYGTLVGSAEQSFIELLMQGENVTKACAVTPCFRDESAYDVLHHAYFMKLELIHTDATVKNLKSMINDARAFFSQYLEVDVIKTGDNMYDIVDAQQGTELGSYGFRSFENVSFIYGTGVALPRLSTVLKG